MAYTSLYRKYRPDTFDKVIGQDHIVRTLKNQIETNSIGHAYIFTGTRGTGKTSVAKIFARAVNCLHPVNGSPCGKCDNCVELANSGNFDILEIDAASNNSVDQIRELTEKINFPPTIGKYKVYIIDEVHMLSKAAFNALLKTLEEPPEHAIFILATTEIHQILPTILSRCLRFDFKLVPNSVIAERIRFIFDDIGCKYEPEAVELIASSGNGSVRDALSVADMCVSYCENNVTYKGVLEVLGASDPQKLISLCTAIADGDIDKTLREVASLCDLGKSV
ncbi:MAG: DNA polymerase III subunit gamma/tau, partial [Clostridia bacterium]|nr:DNA polymerase III subunit gamma/tau [Clostridia bacterium]